MADYLNYKYVSFIDKLEFPVLKVFPWIGSVCPEEERLHRGGFPAEHSQEKQNPNLQADKIGLFP